MQPQSRPGGSSSASASPLASSAFDEATTPFPAVSASKVTCPVCGTTFAPRDSDGKCPICGEQVISPDQISGGIPLITPVGRWILQGDNWRLAAVVALVVYQIILFIALWIHLAQTHAL